MIKHSCSRCFSGRHVRSAGLVLVAAAAVSGCTATPESQSPRSTAESLSAEKTATVNAAIVVTQVVPAEMVAGRDYQISITMRNTGNVAWTPAERYRLGSMNPRDNLIWGLHRVPLSTTVAPGANTTITFTVKAPGMPGVHNFQWRMVQDGVGWFGDPTPNVPVSVATP